MMKRFLVFNLVCFTITVQALAAAKTLADQIDPQTYFARNSPVLNIALIDYGREHTPNQLTDIKNLLEQRFYLATNKMLQLKVNLVKSLPYKHQLINYPSYTKANITDPQRLQRLWYYDFVNAGILSEVYEAVIQTESPRRLDNIDAIATVTGAQFDGLGYAYGRVGVTESPREIAWGLPDGGYTDFVTTGQAVDELIHEIGHTLFLDHAASQCQSSAMNFEQQAACCEASPNKNDVMSYCRDRDAVNDTEIFFGFQACNLRNIKNKIIPRMLSGGAWNIPDLEECR